MIQVINVTAPGMLTQVNVFFAMGHDSLGMRLTITRPRSVPGKEQDQNIQGAIQKQR